MPEFTDLTDEAALAELGHRLARYRLDRNLTQQALAKEAGIHKNTLVRLEGGGSTQSKSLIRVLRALGLLENLDRRAKISKGIVAASRLGVALRPLAKALLLF